MVAKTVILQLNGRFQPKHGHSINRTPTYRVWLDIRARCLRATAPSFQKYGALGVKICERWNEFENFLNDVGARPSTNHNLIRRDPDGDYEPSNCLWSLNGRGKRWSVKQRAHGAPQ